MDYVWMEGEKRRRREKRLDKRGEGTGIEPGVGKGNRGEPERINPREDLYAGNGGWSEGVRKGEGWWPARVRRRRAYGNLQKEGSVASKEECLGKREGDGEGKKNR